MPVAVGQTSKGIVAAAASAATTGVNTTASGSALVVLIGYSDSVNFTSISDTINGSPSGNIWTQIGTEIAFNTGKVRAYYVENANGGTNHIVTVNLNGSAALSVLFVELTGVATSSAVDGTASLVADAASPFASGGVTTTTPTTVLVGGIIGSSGSNPATHAISGAAPAAGWTIQSATEETNGTTNWTGCIATQIVSAAGTYNSGFTESGAGTGATVLLIAFKERATGYSFGMIYY